MPNLEHFNQSQLKKDGRYSAWSAALAALPGFESMWQVDGGVVRVGAPTHQTESLIALLRWLMPWRKGPWSMAGVEIDSEWRCDLKWDRIKEHIHLNDRRVLDVGAGNGYFGWRMLDAGARSVLGCDPTALFVMQHQLISTLAGDDRHALWACRLEDLPHTLLYFDVAFSMGVLSHRRYAESHHMAHLGLLYRTLIPEGQLVLETLVVPESATQRMPNGDRVLVPNERYARMRNVYALPSEETLLHWLEQIGFEDVRVVDVSVTMAEEQRATDWMPYQSLQDGLSAEDPSKTIEGYPRPMRAMVIARRGKK